ncbi:hypothetical protein KG383_005435, partial [Salmonella enterica subsp. enterica serovar Newport]|nr:hypothetical protein [Salmonella enterica subsp. enterica serovar Newport]
MSEQNNNLLDADQLITDVFEKTRIKISKNDPLFITIELHQKILDSILLKIRESNVLITDSLRDKLSEDIL